MKPTKSLLDSTFRYTNAASTDLAKTFARVRREQARAAAQVKPVGPLSIVSLMPKEKTRRKA